MEKKNWYGKYFNNNILNQNVDKFIKILDVNNKKLNLKDKLLLLEKKFSEKINSMVKEISKKDYLEKYKNATSLEILTKEKNIIHLLSEYSLKNSYLDYNFFYNSIKMLLDLSDILKNRLKQPELEHQNYNVKTIPRCSYKFCNYKDSCLFNYTNKHQKCYQDHYVHNMIKADIQVLLNYIKLNFKDSEKIEHNKEIQKSINTISFVISHMEQELKNKCLYQDKSDWETFHFTKKIVSKIEKSNK